MVKEFDAIHGQLDDAVKELEKFKTTGFDLCKEWPRIKSNLVIQILAFLIPAVKKAIDALDVAVEAACKKNIK